MVWGKRRGTLQVPGLGKPLKETPHLIALSFCHPPPASVCNSPAVSGLSYWSPCVPAREQNQVNRQAARQGRENRRERAAAARTPTPGPLETVRCPLRGFQCAPRAGATLGGRWFKARSLQTGDTEATTGTGNSCPSPQSGAAAFASPRAVRFSKKLSPRGRRGRSPGTGDGQREGRLDTPAANDAAQAGRSQLGGEGGLSDRRGRRRKLIHPRA